jgi:cysteine desulfurase
METIYMDYNATTPVREEVLDLMDRLSREVFGNPSSVHLAGRMARACLEDARRKVAARIGAKPEEVYFTSGGSESDNLAIKGAAGLRKTGHIVTTCIEHSAVRRSCEYLASVGFKVTCVPSNGSGYVDPGVLEEAIRPDTFLITMMWANNETGQIQPVEEVARIARRHKVLFHTDAVQAFGKIPVDVGAVPVDLLAISGHKFYAPKGIGALFVRSGVKLAPQIHGGEQEHKLRSGTESVVAAAALAEACRLAVHDLPETQKRLGKLRDKLEHGILQRVPDTKVVGDPARRVANTSNIAFRGVESSYLIQKMDEHGFAISGASACASGQNTPSTVLMKGMGLTREEAAGAIRLSLGRHTDESHIKKFLEVIPAVVEELRGVPSRR